MKKTVLRLYASLIALTLTRGVCCQQTGRQAIPELSIENKVRECVIRYLITKFALPQRTYSTLYFVGVDHEAKNDPPPDLIARLQSSTYRVKGMSQSSDSTSGIRDTKTKELGFLLNIGKVKFISSKHVEVLAQFKKALKGGNGAIYTVDNIKGVWNVTKSAQEVTF